MTEREEFESWARSERLPDDRSGEGYAWHDVQLRWEGWQARAALAQPVAEPDPVMTRKAAAYDHLLPYLCKTCGGYGLVDRRCFDDPLGSEPCPDCNAPVAQPVAAEPEQDTDPFDDRKDAERYRWLREEAQYFSIGRAPAVVLCDEHDLLEKGKTPCEPDGWGFISGSRLDAAIDAARAPTPA